MFSLFFSSQLASDKGIGIEVLPGTPLRMPNVPDYDSFQKVISQLPDVDAPVVFSLPDNIERSLQRSTSTAVITQLRALSTLASKSDKFDREKWRTQVSLSIVIWLISFNMLVNLVYGCIVVEPYFGTLENIIRFCACSEQEKHEQG